MCSCCSPSRRYWVGKANVYVSMRSRSKSASYQRTESSTSIDEMLTWFRRVALTRGELRAPAGDLPRSSSTLRHRQGLYLRRHGDRAADELLAGRRRGGLVHAGGRADAHLAAVAVAADPRSGERAGRRPARAPAPLGPPDG